MAYPSQLSITNPGFEGAGGWSDGGANLFQYVTAGDAPFNDGNTATYSVAFSGSKFLVNATGIAVYGGGPVTEYPVYQDLTFDGGFNADVDAGNLSVTVKAWWAYLSNVSFTPVSKLEFEFLDAVDATISTSTSANIDLTGGSNLTQQRWQEAHYTAAVPTLTRKIRVKLISGQTNNDDFTPVVWDSVSVEMFLTAASVAVVEQASVDVVAALESNAEVGQLSVEVLESSPSYARVFQEYAEFVGQGTSDVRVFQEYAEALTAGPGVVRVYQEYAELICNIPIPGGGGGTGVIAIFMMG